MTADQIKRFKWGSTWRLFGLAVITLAIYLVYYARRQTLILNESLPPEKQIGVTFFRWWFVIAYISLTTFFIRFFVAENNPWGLIDNIFGCLLNFFELIWAFRARARFNQVFQSEEGTSSWFKAIWILFFQAFYINFKINSLLESLESKDQATG